MRASRLLSIQMLLETRGRMSARALADALEVSPRTLHRDVDQLAAAGVPIFATRGRQGGFALLEGWKTTLTGLTPGEAQAVFLSGLAGPAAELGLGPQVEAARLKVLTALPRPWREDAQRVSSRFHLDPLDWYRETEAVPHLATVAAAVWDERALALRYESWRGLVERVVEPLGLVLKAGVWYLVAAVDGAPRTYRVASIRAARRLEARCKRPRHFALPAYWTESLQRFERALYTGHAQVRATADGIERLRRLGTAVARAVAAPPPSRRQDGRVALRIPIESIAHAARQLVALAPEVEVVGPAALRAAIVARLAQSVRCYGVGRRTRRPA